MNSNIAYQTDRLASYFSRNRIAWPQFYESERVIIGGLGLDERHAVLDIGCGCGGLGLALREKYGVVSYAGVEINALAAEAASRMNPRAEILRGDILELNDQALHGRWFDVVFSLSCIDWNVQFAEMLTAAWSRVRSGGCLVGTFRLTELAGCADIGKSYQYINFEGVREGELAAYVVLNAAELMQRLLAFEPAQISAYGYWGPPSSTAITPYQRLCFSAISIRKRDDSGEPLRLQLDLPTEIRDAMDPAQSG